MFQRKNAKARIAAVAGAAVLGGLAVAGTAQAMPDDHPNYDRYCTPEQVEVTLSPVSHAMGKAGSAVNFTAKPGQSCLLGGTPGLIFQDAQGQNLDVQVERPAQQPAPMLLEAGQTASAQFTYRFSDPETGPLPGANPATVEVAFPDPLGAYVVDLPWDGSTVAGPVSVQNAALAQS